MKKLTTILYLILTIVCQLMATESFRLHRYDMFSVLPVRNTDIVFMGNSITDMPNWHEFFSGYDGRILNRGNSGGFSNEMVEALPHILEGKPAKIFLMIGTNDLAIGRTPDEIAANVKKCLDMTKAASPLTELYILSILPAKESAHKTTAKIEQTNKLYKTLVKKAKNKRIHFIDLYDKLQGITEGMPYSQDGLHLSAYSYKIWAEAIAPFLGPNVRCIIPADIAQTQATARLPHPNGVRNTYFSAATTSAEDFLLIGDEMIKCGEWHELLDDQRALNRGYGWGYGGSISTISQSLDIIIGNGKPQRIALYTATDELNSSLPLDSVAHLYCNLLDEIRDRLPLTQIILMSNLPVCDSVRNAIRIKPFTRWQKALAEAVAGVSFVDLYTPFSNDDIADRNYIAQGTAKHELGFLTGAGYLRVAKMLKAVPTTVFGNLDGGIPYRIPALAQASNGNLIAVADYRTSRQDIGWGKTDLHLRLSHDGGRTWGETMRPEVMDGAFGDATIVADRESSRVMIMSCSGHPGYFDGTRQQHQGLARWYSADNGETWASAPAYIDEEQIYSVLDKSKYGPIAGMFVASGKILQSRHVKAGDYYRLYCALSCHKPGVRDSQNFVIYSDDFGQNWHFLGGTDNPAVEHFGDEPKVEELPDGSLLFSGRISNQGGRHFRIFRFADISKAAGSWGELVISSSKTDGGIGGDNACNGDILIVPALSSESGKEVQIALQSVAVGPGRSHVGIYYKVLDGEESYSSAQQFVSGWEGPYFCTSQTSAYSTMCLNSKPGPSGIKTEEITILFEENGYNSGYDIQFLSLSLEQITEGKYSLK